MSARMLQHILIFDEIQLNVPSEKWPVLSCIGQFVLPGGTKEVNYKLHAGGHISLLFCLCAVCYPSQRGRGPALSCG